MAKRYKEFDPVPYDIRTCTDDEWKDIEEYYIDCVNEIEIPPDLSPKGILRINAMVDQVYSQARFDAAYAKRQLNRIKRRYSNAQKQLKLTFTKQKGQTAEEREALILQYLETSPLKGDKEPLFTQLERWEDRAAFMDAVLDNLLKKTEKMITGNGALKLDAQGRGDVRE